MEDLYFDTQLTSEDVAIICAAYSLYIEEVEREHKRHFNAPPDKKRNLFKNINIAKNGMDAFINQQPITAAQMLILYPSLQYLKEIIVSDRRSSSDKEEISELRNMRDQINTILTKLKPLYDSVNDEDLSDSYL